MALKQKFKKEFDKACGNGGKIPLINPDELKTASAEEGLIMNHNSQEQFEKVLQNRCLSMRKTLSIKAEEYSKGSNRYHNFNVAARILGTTPEKALLGMWMKHIVSVLDMIAEEKPMDEKVIDEKIGDLINYAVLLEGLWKR